MTTITTTSDSHLKFSEFQILQEALDSDLGDIHRDEPLENLAKMALEPESRDSVRVMYNNHMLNNDIRVIKFKNTSGHVEYHVHSNSTFPGAKASNESNRGFLSAVKLIHDDGLKELSAGNPVALHSVAGSDQYPKYKAIATRLAQKANRAVHELGNRPLSSMPFFEGPVLLIK